MPGRPVTLCAGHFVRREISFQRSVRQVASEAAQTALAFPETSARGEHKGLVTGIPRVE